MIHADMFLRGAAIALAFLCAAVLLSRSESRRIGWPVAALAVTLTFFLVETAPGLAGMPDALPPLLHAGTMLEPFAFTWLVTEIFLDEARQRRPWLIAAGVTVAASLGALAIPGMGRLCAVLVLVLFAALIWLGLSTAKTDLVEHRRRFRPGFLIAMALLGFVITALDIASGVIELPQLVYTMQAGAVLALAFAFALWVLNPAADLCCDRVPEPPRETSRKAAIDSANIEALNAAMAGGIWQREGLTIAELGREIGMPEHRLRALINQRLGFRNFPTFINSYRIKAAKAALADPGQARRTILEIAYDSGFASLGPFNKAFRDQTGESPSEYRARVFDSATSPAISENPSAISESARPRAI